MKTKGDYNEKNCMSIIGGINGDVVYFLQE